MENSAPEPDYLQILRDYPYEQISLDFQPDLELLQNDDILQDCAEYYKLRADILSAIVGKFVQSEIDISLQLEASYKLAKQNDPQNLELENQMLKSLLVSGTSPYDQSELKHVLARQAMRDKLCAGQSVSECLLQILAENQALAAENKKFRAAAMGLSRSEASVDM